MNRNHSFDTETIETFCFLKLNYESQLDAFIRQCNCLIFLKQTNKATFKKFKSHLSTLRYCKPSGQKFINIISFYDSYKVSSFPRKNRNHASKHLNNIATNKLKTFATIKYYNFGSGLVMEFNRVAIRQFSYIDTDKLL